MRSGDSYSRTFQLFLNSRTFFTVKCAPEQHKIIAKWFCLTVPVCLLDFSERGLGTRLGHSHLKEQRSQLTKTRKLEN